MLDPVTADGLCTCTLAAAAAAAGACDGDDAEAPAEPPAYGDDVNVRSTRRSAVEPLIPSGFRPLPCPWPPGEECEYPGDEWWPGDGCECSGEPPAGEAAPDI